MLGAQGSGKTALVERFVADLSSKGVLVAEGRCRESGDLVPFASIREAAGQLGQALRALPDWRKVSADHRAEYLELIAAEMRNRRFELAAWIVYECGKPWADADGDATRRACDL